MPATLDFLDLGGKMVASSVLPDHYFSKLWRSYAGGRVIDCCVGDVCYVRHAGRQRYGANARRVCVGVNGGIVATRPGGLERHVSCSNNVPTVVVRVIEDDGPTESW